MNPECSIPVLESALAGELSERDEESLHHHLEHCEACSAALEQLAGGLALRQEAAELLLDDDLDRTEAEAGEPSDIDFTVEHLEPADEPNVLGRLGGYEILEVIGRGGMGVVLKGYDRELKRCVALKVLAPHLANSALARKRFTREAQAAAAIVHPNVLAIHQVQPVGPLPFLVMPLVAGETLAQRLTREGTLELKECLRIGMQTAAALSAAHEQGLVHRDVKPANILVERGIERAMLMDFGLARANDDVTMTRWGVIAGTPQYMSPEQARGEALDGRSDLFGLGCVLYEMATGVSPFRADSVMATLRRLVEDPAQPLASLAPELPPWYVRIVERLLEKNPERRFASAKEVSEVLEVCLGHLQQPARVSVPANLQPSSPPRSRILTARFFGGIVMLATLGAVLLGGFMTLTSEPQDIAGAWTGEDWGTVILERTGEGRYEGTYTDTFGKAPGEIRLAWSRIERRYNGTWREGDDRFGELSIRLVDGEIRGALTTDAKSKINPATPHLADLLWVRAKPESKRPPPAVVPPVVPAPPVMAPAPDPSVVHHVRDMVGAEGTVRSLMLSKDDMLLYACTDNLRRDGRIRVWDLATGELRHTLAEPPTINALAMSPDGTRFLGCSSEGRIVMWDAKTNTPLRAFWPNKEGITALAWAKDGKRFVSGGADGHVRLWNADSGEILWDGIGHHAGVHSAAFIPGDQRILTFDFQGGFRLWDVAKGTSTRFPTIEDDVLAAHVVMPMPDGKRILVCGDRDSIWDLETSKEVVKFEWQAPLSRCADISPDGKYVVTGGEDGRTRLFDAKTGRLIEALPPQNKQVRVVKFASDSKTFFSAGGAPGQFANTSPDYRVKVWRYEPDRRSPAAPIDGTASPTKIEAPSEKFSVDFRAGRPLPAELAPRTPLAASRTNIAPGGLRIDMPANRKNLDPVAFDTAFGLRGDFDIVATYEILNADAPVAGDGIGVLIGIKSAPIRREAWVGWMLRGVDKEVAQWHRGEAGAGEVMNIEGGEEKWVSRLGRLRLQRRGKLLEYSIAPGVAGDDFQRLSRWVYGDSDIQSASLIAGTNGQAKTLDARWLDLSITADKLLRREAPRPPGRLVR